MNRAERAFYEKYQESAVYGRMVGSDGGLSAQDCQRLVEGRCQAALRVTGMTPQALKQEDPKAYDRLIAGHWRCLIREGMAKRGELSRSQLRAMWSREEQRRAGVEVESVYDAFDEAIEQYEAEGDEDA